MENLKGFIELTIAGAYTIHAAIELRGSSTGHGRPHRAKHSPKFSAEVSCLIAVAMSYYAMASLSLALGH
jgi:hypothetical protein